jgi:hypothetical protein
MEPAGIPCEGPTKKRHNLVSEERNLGRDVGERAWERIKRVSWGRTEPRKGPGKDWWKNKDPKK